MRNAAASSASEKGISITMLNKFTFLIFIILVFFQKTEAQVNFTIPSNQTPATINYAEYFIDTDPGFGSATPIALSSSSDITINNLSTDLSSVPSGVHRIGIRSKDANGTWSLTNVKSFFKLFQDVIIPANPSAMNIMKLEYFIDTDPGFGNGTSIPVTLSDDITANNYSLDISSLTPGVHHILFRTQDASGKWSLVNWATFFVANVAAQIPPNPTSANIVKMEYFIDNDPGLGNGIPITISSGTDVSATSVAIDLTGLSDGVHRIYVRTQDANGSWSETNLQTFNILMANVSIPSNPAPGNITKIEYFFDTDPGFGNGTAINLAPTTDLSNYSLVVDISALKNDSAHTLYIRTLDGWSLTNTQSFIKGVSLPLTWLSFNAKEIDGKIQLDWATAQESNTDVFEIERSSDGAHFENIGSVKAAGNTTEVKHYIFSDENPLNGIAYYRIEQADRDGKSSYSVVIRVRMDAGFTVLVVTNPVSNQLRVQISGSGQKRIPLMILNAAGKNCKEISAHEGDQVINIQSLSAGMYYLSYPSGFKIISIPFTKL